MTRTVWMKAILLLGLAAWAFNANAGGFDNGIPEGWTCEGRCGTSAANGVVTLAEGGGSQYGWVSTNGGQYGKALPSVGGTNASRLRSKAFSAKAGDTLEFQFNYVTSDGAGFADYGWARVLDSSLNQVALLFTARTTPGGSTVPGFGMPSIEAEITPETVMIVRGRPTWSPLGGSSGACYSSGCGYTGWVQSKYVFPATGDYILEFGASNWGDSAYDSGLAFDGITVGGTPIGEEPHDYEDVRVIAKLPNDGILLDPNSFATPPLRIEQFTDRVEVEWTFDQFSIDQLETLDFEITVIDPQASEIRPVVHEVLVLYKDLTGMEHRLVLGPQDVEVYSSIFDIGVSTDRASYGADQTVNLGVTVTNLSDFPAVTSAHVTIQDGAGNLVADLGTVSDIALASGASHVLNEFTWFTGRAYVGTYKVSAELFDQQGVAIDSATAFFSVVSPDVAQAVGSVTTDKPSYEPGELLRLQDRVRNAAANAMLDGMTAVTTVYDPSGDQFWTASAVLPQITPEGFYDLAYTVPLGQAAAGEYRVKLLVKDDAGTTQASAETKVYVASTQETGQGLRGVLTVVPQPVLKTEHLAIVSGVQNDGNSAAVEVPVTLRIIDPSNQQVIAQWDEVISRLDIGQTYSLNKTWMALAPASSTFAAVLTAHVAGNEKVLATTTFVIAEKLHTELELGGKGRLLVLLDDGVNGACNGLSELDLQLRPAAPMMPGDQVDVELYDANHVLIDAESVRVGTSTVPYNANSNSGADLAIFRLTSSQIEVGILGQGKQGKLTGQYHVVATHWEGSGGGARYESAAVSSDCGKATEGAMYGQFKLTATYSLDKDEPYGPEGSPSLQVQRHALKTILDRAGWSYTVATTADDFERAMHSGGYSVYGLFNEQVKLPEDVQASLVEEVRRGAGLVYGSYHDRRNGRLEPALGIRSAGKLPFVTGVQLDESDIHPGADLSFVNSGEPLQVYLDGAHAIGTYASSGEVAVTSYFHGKGRGIYIGFDVLAQTAVNGPSSPFASLITGALSAVSPKFVAPIAGRVVPLTLTLTNAGSAVSGEVFLSLPPEVVAVDPGPAVVQPDERLLWKFQVPYGETISWPFWLQMPDASGTTDFVGQLFVRTSTGAFIDYGPVQLSVTVQPRI